MRRPSAEELKEAWDEAAHALNMEGQAQCQCHHVSHEEDPERTNFGFEKAEAGLCPNYIHWKELDKEGPYGWQALPVPQSKKYKPICNGCIKAGHKLQPPPDPPRPMV